MTDAPGARRSFPRRVAVATGVVLAILVVVAVLWQAFDVFLLFFAGLLASLVLRAMAEPVAERTGWPYGAALAAVAVGLLLVVVGAGWLLAPQVAEQVDRLSETLPRSIERLTGWLERYGWGRALLEQEAQIRQSFGSSQFLSRATGVASATFGVVADAVVVLFLALYLAAQPRRYREGLVRLVPPARRDRAREVLGEVTDTLRGWLVGQLAGMTVIGVATAIGLWALGIPLALLLALLAALLTFIPNFGPVLSAVPAVLLALAVSPTKALWVIALYAGIQTVESYLVTPLIQERAIRLPPALLIGAQVLMAVLAGLPGLALATPLVAAAMVLVQRLYVEDVLGDRERPVGAGG